MAPGADSASVRTASTVYPATEPTAPAIHTIPSRLSRVQSRTVQPTGDVEKNSQIASGDEEAVIVPSDDNIRTITGYRWFLVCVSLYIGSFLYGLDTTIAADVQGAAVETFGDVDKLAWVGAGFPLGSVAVILLVGALYTSFNMRWIYVASIVFFEGGSALCGGAPNMSALIVGRIIAGVGGCGMFTGGLNYFSSLTTREERGTFISLIGFVWGLGCVLGPVIGGSFSVSSATWRWAFYINLVVGAVTAPIYLLFLPSLHPTQGTSCRTRIANLDFVGSFLNAGVWVSFTMALTMAGGQWPWDDGRTIGTFVAFGATLLVYALQQYFCVFTTPQTRAFPVHLLRSRTQVLIYIATSANITALFVVVYFIPIYFQFVHNDSALMAAVRLLPAIVVTVSVNLAAGYLLSRIQYYKLLYIVSGIFMTLGGALLTAYLAPDTTEGVIYGFTVLTALGTGMTVQTGFTIATLAAPVSDMGDAISLQNVSQIGSTVIALVVAGQIFQSEAIKNLQVALAGQGFTEEEIRGAVVGAQSVLFGELSGTLRQAAIAAVTSAMQRSFALVVVGGAVLLIAGVCMKLENLFE